MISKVEEGQFRPFLLVLEEQPILLLILLINYYYCNRSVVLTIRKCAFITELHGGHTTLIYAQYITLDVSYNIPEKER